MPLKTDMLGTLLLLGIAWFCLVLQANARSEVGHLMCHHICFSKVLGKLLRKCGPHLSFRKWPSSQLVGGWVSLSDDIGPSVVDMALSRLRLPLRTLSVWALSSVFPGGLGWFGCALQGIHRGAWIANSTLLCTCITLQIHVNSLSWSNMDLWDSLGTSTIQWDMKCRERSDRDLTGGSLQTI